MADATLETASDLAEICNGCFHIFSSYTHHGSEVYTIAECLPAG